MTVYFVVKPMSLSCFASLREILSFAIRSSMLGVRRSLVCSSQFWPVPMVTSRGQRVGGLRSCLL